MSEGYKQLYVCRKHYLGLVLKDRVVDFLPEQLHDCQMVGCRSPSFREVLVGAPGSRKTRYVSLKNNELVEVS